MKIILFVCTGNTCRSCMAEGILKNYLEKDDILNDNFTVSSAGIYSYPGDCASENSVRVLKEEYNIDISCHKSKQLSDKDIEVATIILTMTREHKKAIVLQYPHANTKVFTLKEYVYSPKTDLSTLCHNLEPDITDPYGMPLETYRYCAREINHAVKKLAKILKETL